MPDLDLHLLPVALAALADELGRIYQQKPNAHALAGLAVLLTAVGANIQVAIPGGELAPALDWFVIVGDSGSGKTPVMSAFLEPLQRRQAQWDGEYRDALISFKERMRMGGQAAQGLEKPVLKTLIHDDSTFEVMTVDLAEYGRGSVWYSDELLGLFNSLDAYKPRGGRSLQGLLQTWNAQAIRRRRIKDAEVTIVPRAVVSILGGIQPTKIHELGPNTDGRLARMLAVTLEEGEEPLGDPRLELKGRWADLVFALLDSRPHSLQTLGMEDKAWLLFRQREGEMKAWRRALPAEEQAEIKSYVSKLGQHAGRIALALWAGFHERAWPLPALDPDTIDAAWALTRALLQHQLRVFRPAEARTGLRPEQLRMSDEVEKFDAWLRGKWSSPASRREVQMYCKTWRGGLFGSVLDEWRKRGYGRLVSSGKRRLLEWED